MKHLARALALLPIMIFICGAFAQDEIVTILGAVHRPGAYPIDKGEKFSSLIERAGGFTDNAWLRGAVLSRESAKAAKEPLLRDSISRIEREAFAKRGEEERKREFIATLSELKPAKRIPVRLTHPRLLKGTGDDLPLEGGDSLFVPPKAGTVTVTGAVTKPGTVSPHNPKADAEDYVKKAGGFAEDADRNHTYLLKADGTALPLSREWIRWSPKQSRWEIPALVEPEPPIEPGDTIVVPRKPPRSSWARDITALPQLLMEIHALTGVRVDSP